MYFVASALCQFILLSSSSTDQNVSDAEISSSDSHRSLLFSLKQPVERLQELSRNFKGDAFAFEWAESGAMVLPQYKTVLCSYPKAGTTTTKWLLLALLGYNKSTICDPGNKHNVQFNHGQYVSKGMRYVRNMGPRFKQSYNRGWDDNVYIGPSLGVDNKTLEYNWEVARMFLDPEWTTIAFVRDPWWRAISMWHHQLFVVKRITKYKDFEYLSRSSFMDFVANFSSEAGRLHTGAADHFCGMKYVNYDIYVDIDRIAEGLEHVMKSKPEWRSVFTEGWENCTLNRTGSLVADQASQDHAMVEFGNKNDKLVKYDELFCDPSESMSSQRIVFERYHNDYKMFNKTPANFQMHTHCVHLYKEAPLDNFEIGPKAKGVDNSSYILLTPNDLVTDESTVDFSRLTRIVERLRAEKDMIDTDLRWKLKIWNEFKGMNYSLAEILNSKLF